MKRNTLLDYFLGQCTGGVKNSDFINKWLILFSQADNAHSILHLYDCFKLPSQCKRSFLVVSRRILRMRWKLHNFVVILVKNQHTIMKSFSLQGTIVNMMAQDFTRSNIVNLLTPSGQPGTWRIMTNGWEGQCKASFGIMYSKYNSFDINNTNKSPQTPLFINSPRYIFIRL